MLRIKTADIATLKSLAEYRALTLPQLTALHFSGKKAAGRRLGQFVQENLVESIPRGPGRAPGRPESVFSLANAGIERLRDEGILRHSAPYEGVNAEQLLPCLDHQLLTNWFRIHLAQTEKLHRCLTIRFLAPTSPFVGDGSDDRPRVRDAVLAGEAPGKPAHFTPDGVFSIACKKQDKALLFFLEVDRGTESRASLQRGPGDVRQKVLNYQTYFRQGGYKRYEATLEGSFNGFRLLILAHTAPNRTGLCRLVQDMRPSGFIWVTDQDRMFVLVLWVLGRAGPLAGCA